MGSKKEISPHFLPAEPERDLFIARNRDASTVWEATADALDELMYMLQNHNDVSVILDENGEIVERVKYTLTGIPFGLTCGDTDCDRDTDQSDVDAISGADGYYMLMDLNLDGLVNGDDVTIARGWQGTSLGQGELSATGNRRGWRGAEHVPGLALTFLNALAYNLELGELLQADPNRLALLLTSLRQFGPGVGPADDPTDLDGEERRERAQEQLWLGDEDCCKAALEWRLKNRPNANSKPEALTVCCKGRAIACIYLDHIPGAESMSKRVRRIILNQLRKHEELHIEKKHVDCAGAEDGSANGGGLSHGEHEEWYRNDFRRIIVAGAVIPGILTQDELKELRKWIKDTADKYKGTPIGDVVDDFVNHLDMWILED